MNKREFPNHSSRQAFELQHARRSFRISIDPVPSPDGTETESILVLTETTSQKRTEEALRVAEHLAATGRLAHSIAHEINNPLEAVTNLLYLLRREVATGTLAAEYVEKADRELARVGHITKQTLSFSRNSSAPESIALNVLIENVLDLYRADLTMKQIKIEKRYDRSAEIKVHAGQIRQVFSNLIANAIHAVSQKGRISIRVNRSRSWKRGKNGIRVIIADNGEGIARENTSKIFEAFFTTKKHNGSGLGLWLSLGIITAHGGEIRVRSTRHSDWHGSCFSVFLPFAHSSASESGFVTSDAVA
jgi:signal transduction histidine kinase